MSQTLFGNGLGYEGKVTITLKSNGHILKSTTYKNNGTAQLFKFLGYCLLGDYKDVSRLLPKKILLLFDDPNDISSSLVPQSTWHSYAQTPTIISNSSGDSSTHQVKVMYNFEIPRAAIAGPFNMVALYGSGVEDITEFSAFYYLTDSSGNHETQDVGNWSATTILLIEWELTLSNKETEITIS